MTVNELMAQLRAAQRAGFGDRPAYVFQEKSEECREIRDVTKYHNKWIGHLVISDYTPSWKKEAPNATP